MLVSLIVESSVVGCIFPGCGASGCFGRFLVGDQFFYIPSLVGAFLVQFPISLVFRPIRVLPCVSVSCLMGIFVASPLIVCSYSWAILVMNCRIPPLCSLIRSVFVLVAPCSCSWYHLVSFPRRMRSSRMSYLSISPVFDGFGVSYFPDASQYRRIFWSRRFWFLPIFACH